MQRCGRHSTPGAPSQCQLMLGNPPLGFTPKVGLSGQLHVPGPEEALGLSRCTDGSLAAWACPDRRAVWVKTLRPGKACVVAAREEM